MFAVFILALTPALETPELRITLEGPGLRLRHALLADGRTVLLIAHGVGDAAEDLAKEIERQIADVCTVDSRALPKDGEELRLRCRNDVHSARMTRLGKRQVLTLQVLDPATQRSQRQAHILAPWPRSVPSAYASTALTEAQRLLDQGELVLARHAFAQQLELPIVGIWARLRVADVEWLLGETAVACAAYAEIAAAVAERTAGTLAALRRVNLGCASLDAQTVDRLYSLVGLEGRLRAFFAREIERVITMVEEPEAVDLALGYLEDPDCLLPEALRSVLTDRVVARLVRQAPTPMRALAASLDHRDSLTRHREARDLCLEAAEAALSLSLPDQAIEAATLSDEPRLAASPLWQDRDGELQALAIRAQAHGLRGDRIEAAQLQRIFAKRSGRPWGDVSPAPSPAAPDDLDGLRALFEGLEGRLHTLERVADDSNGAGQAPRKESAL